MKRINEIVAGRPVYTVRRDENVQEAAGLMSQHKIGAMSVMDGNRLVGVFSERDVINRVVARRLDPAKTTVGTVMTSNIVVARPEDTLESCLKKMKLANCRHLPVVDGEVLIGMVSLRDLLQVDIGEKEDRLEVLQNYMFHLPPGDAHKS
jgi:CBS domain-containing protein